MPGVGKSTFIDQLGVNLIADGHRVAVLAVDPSSGRTGGVDPRRQDPHGPPGRRRARVRPAVPSAGTLGGVAKATRETMLVMEAAGYDVVLVETVGVGQSEYVVADMVDTFLFLTLARTGDSLQGMKRGILELADVIAVNKADEQHEDECRAGGARAVRRAAVAARRRRRLAGAGDDVQRAAQHRPRPGVEARAAAPRLARPGTAGSSASAATSWCDWTRAMVRDRLLARLDAPGRARHGRGAEDEVLAGELTPDQAATRILACARRP